MRKHNPGITTDPSDVVYDVEAVGCLMFTKAENNPIPERFVTVPSENEPSITIVDTETGRSTKVPPFAYSAVRKTLTELFS